MSLRSQEKQALKIVRFQRHLALTIQFYISCRITGVPPLQSDFLAQVASAAWAKVRARVRSAGDGVRAGLGQPATFTREGAPQRPQIR